MKSGLAVRNNAQAPIINDNTSVTITAAAYVTLAAATSKSISAIEVQNTSAKTIKLALGAAAAEVDFYACAPGVNGIVFPKEIPKGTRISAKAITADATTGALVINSMA